MAANMTKYNGNRWPRLDAIEVHNCLLSIAYYLRLIAELRMIAEFAALRRQTVTLGTFTYRQVAALQGLASIRPP